MAKIYLNGVAYLGGGASDADSVKVVSWDSIPTPDLSDVIGRAVFNSADNHFYSITENSSHNKVWSQITMPSDVSVAAQNFNPDDTPTGTNQLIYNPDTNTFYISKQPTGQETPVWEAISFEGGALTIALGLSVSSALAPAVAHPSAHYYAMVTEALMAEIIAAGLDTRPNVTYYIVEE